MSRSRLRHSVLLALGLVPTLALPAPAQSPDFKGETISLQIGYGPGGGYDTYGRVLARHYGRLIPGNPTVVAKNMPGAGSLRAANHIYQLGARDPVELGIFSASTAMEPLMGNEQAKFDAAKFGWVGSMNQDVSFCGVWQGPDAAKSFEELLRKDRPEAIFGSAGPAAISHQHPLVIKNVLGANLRVISGYEGQKAVNLAMQRGEVHGACGLFVSSIKAQWLPNIKAGDLKLVLQMGPKTTDEFGKIPSVFDYVKTDDDRKVLELHFRQTILGRPVAASPNLPKDRLAVLRKALMDTMKDPEFLAEAQKTSLDIDPATGEQVEELLKQFADYPKSVIEKAKAAIGR